MFNGYNMHDFFIDTSGTCYRFAIIAIGIMLENVFPDKALLVASEETIEEIDNVVDWLSFHFNEEISSPVIFNKTKVLKLLLCQYDEKVDVVSRMAQIYKNEFKRNMKFAIKNIGYEYSFQFYAHVLSKTVFGTFGFSDVLDAWIAATEDLTCVLNLISQSKRLLIENGDSKAVKKYNLEYILKSLLNNYILWNPIQREDLEKLYNNKKMLETGEDDLFGSIMRMTGMRIDICPIIASKKELFESFMYHDPKKGAEYKLIIDKWIEKNKHKYEEFKSELSKFEDKQSKIISENIDEEDMLLEIEQKNFIEKYSEHERYFIKNALRANPVYLNIEEHIELVCEDIETIILDEECNYLVESIKTESKEVSIKRIRARIKDLRMVLSTSAKFENCIEEEDDPNVFLHLSILLALKINNRLKRYVQHEILWNVKHWNRWRRKI